jgi:imidazolonepropionase-like amidohydrolase
MKRALENVFLIDGTGAPPVRNASILLQDDRIEAVGPSPLAALDPDTEIVDLEGRSLLPGLIDLHTHCTVQYYFHSETVRTFAEPYSETLVALAAVSRLEEALLAGQTTLRDTGSLGNTIFDLREAIERGFIRGPRLCAAGRYIIPTGGLAAAMEPRLVVEADGEANVRAAVRQRIKDGADFIKVAINDTEWTQAELNAAVDEAHRWGLRVACHVVSAASTKMAITAGVNTLEHARFFDDDDIAAMADQGIAVVTVASGPYDKVPAVEKTLLRPDLSPELRRELEQKVALSRQVLAVMPDNYRRALAAGVKIAAGTDRVSSLGKEPFAAVARELEVLCELGLTPLQALQSATGVAAAAMGWGDRVGAIAAGMLADILVVDGNPLDDISALRNVAMVIKGGEIVVGRELVVGRRPNYSSTNDEVV